MAQVTRITTPQQLDDLISSDGHTVIFFYSLLQESSDSVENIYLDVADSPDFDDIVFCMVNQEEHKNVADRMDIKNHFDILVFRNGTKLSEVVWDVYLDDFQDYLREVNNEIHVTKIRSPQQFDEIISSHNYTVVFFYYSTDEWAREVKPVFRKTAASPEFDGFTFAMVDQGNQESIADRIEMEFDPAIVIFRDGKKVLEEYADQTFHYLEDCLHGLNNTSRITQIKTQEQFDEITSSDNYTIIDFYAPWCGWCIVIRPQYRELSLEYGSERFHFCLVNGDNQESICPEVEIEAYPTIMTYRDGEMIEEVSISEIPSWIDKHRSRPSALPLTNSSKDDEATKLRDESEIGLSPGTDASKIVTPGKDEAVEPANGSQSSSSVPTDPSKDPGPGKGRVIKPTNEGQLILIATTDTSKDIEPTQVDVVKPTDENQITLLTPSDASKDPAQNGKPHSEQIAAPKKLPKSCSVSPPLAVKKTGLLSLISSHKKPAMDPEPGCVFNPRELGTCLSLGETRYKDSYLSATFCEDPNSDNTVVNIHLNFLADTNTQSRFTSAFFSVTFGYEDKDKGFIPLLIGDMSPTKEEEGATEAAHTIETEVGMTLGVSGGKFATAGVDGQARRRKQEVFDRRTAATVKGIGKASSTARWTFEENRGHGGQLGLEPEYDLAVHLAKSGFITIRFWVKAVLVTREGRPVVLSLGSEEKPYIKHLNFLS